MTWSAEFGQAVYQAAQLDAERRGRQWLDAARDAILVGHPDDLLAAYPDGVRIDDPRAGRVEGIDALRAYCEESRAWMEERQSRARQVAVTVGRLRVVGEYELELTQDGNRLTLPVAVVIEPETSGHGVWIRTYHSQWPLLGHHVVRPPLLAPDPEARESDVVGEYQDALAAGDTERIIATYEVDGCFREPSGPEYRRCGTDALTELYRTFFSAGGGIVLEHCTVTEDGVRTALEFNALRWGAHDLPRQAGVAVYERGRMGRIAEARVYDDVDPPRSATG